MSAIEPAPAPLDNAYWGQGDLDLEPAAADGVFVLLALALLHEVGLDAELDPEPIEQRPPDVFHARGRWVDTDRAAPVMPAIRLGDERHVHRLPAPFVEVAHTGPVRTCPRPPEGEPS